MNVNSLPKSVTVIYQSMRVRNYATRYAVSMQHVPVTAAERRVERRLPDCVCRAAAMRAAGVVPSRALMPPAAGAARWQRVDRRRV